MTYKVLVSAPVYKRAWILPRWFEALDKQSALTPELNFNLGFQFLGVESDKKTHTVILSGIHSLSSRPWRSKLDLSDKTEQDLEHHQNGRRIWNVDRYAHMANLRNHLFQSATRTDMDFFFSLDTDILLEDPHTISKLILALQNEDIEAVAPLVYMTKSTTSAPNCMRWVDDSQRATRAGVTVESGFQEVGVILGAKMMTSEVVQNTSYEKHPQGEDLGWGLSMREQNFKCGLLGNVYGTHVMSSDHLNEIEQNGDIRKKSLE